MGGYRVLEDVAPADCAVEIEADDLPDVFATAARMLAAWIISQAGWTLEAGQTAAGRFVISRQGRPIQLILTGTESARPIPLVQFKGPLGTVSLTHESSNPYIQTQIQLGEGVLTRLTPSPSGTPAELVTERLRRGCRTKHYFALLQMVKTLLQA
jgi:hypothetical protein